MSEQQESKGLSKLEWFGLISGLVGLSADIITLSALFKHSQSQANISVPTVQLTFSLWLLLFFGISYAVLIASFYARRILIKKRRMLVRRFPNRRRGSVESGVLTITLLIGMPLFLFHFILLFHVISQNIGGLDPPLLKKLMSETDSASAIVSIGARWFILAPLLSFVMCGLMDSLAKVLYSSLR